MDNQEENQYAVGLKGWLFAHQVSLGVSDLDNDNLAVIPVWRDTDKSVKVEKNISVQIPNGTDANGDTTYLDSHKHRLDNKKYPLKLLIPYNLSGNHFELAQFEMSGRNFASSVIIFNQLEETKSNYQDLKKIVRDELGIRLPFVNSRSYSCDDKKIIGCSDGRCGDAVIAIARLKAEGKTANYAHLPGSSYQIDISRGKVDIFDSLRQKHYEKGWVPKKVEAEIVQDLKKSGEILSKEDQAYANKKHKKDSQWKLEIHQLDVGQGDSALILFKKLNPDTKNHEVNKSILIDGGLGFNAKYINDYVTSKIGNHRNLDAVIITHFDADHYFGIAESMFIMTVKQGGKSIERILRRKESDIFTEDTQFIIPEKDDPSSQKMIDALFKYYWKGNRHQGNISYGKGMIGKSVWNVFGELEKPSGAPDFKIISAEGFYKKNGERKNLYKQKVDSNERSVVSLAQMNEFRFYTAGDFEKNTELINCVFSKPNSSHYYPIQAFLYPHHGSKKNTIPSELLKKMGSRAALVSAGDHGQYKHPHKDALESMNKTNVSTCYLTNKRHGLFGDIKYLDKEFIVAGENTPVDAKTSKNKKPRGTIKIKTYQNISEAGEEKFMVKYRNPQSKTRDYYKDKDFSVLKKEIFSYVKLEEKDLATLKSGNEVRIPVSLENLRSFLDEGDDNGNNTKTKHINPRTIKKFFEKYLQNEVENDQYMLSFKINDKEISINIYHQEDQYRKLKNDSNIRTFESQVYAKGLFERVKSFGIFKESYGIKLSLEEFWDFKNGHSLEKFVKKREETPKNHDTGYFLRVEEPISEKIVTTLSHRPLSSILTKQYHKDSRESISSKGQVYYKTIARRIEYGENKDRILNLKDEEVKDNLVSDTEVINEQTKVNLFKWRDAMLEEKTFDSHKCNSLIESIETSNLELSAQDKSAISEVVAQSMKNPESSQPSENSEKLLLLLSEKDFLDHNYVINSLPLTYQVSNCPSDSKSLFWTCCKKSDNAALIAVTKWIDNITISQINIEDVFGERDYENLVTIIEKDYRTMDLQEKKVISDAIINYFDLFEDLTYDISDFPKEGKFFECLARKQLFNFDTLLSDNETALIESFIKVGMNDALEIMIKELPVEFLDQHDILKIAADCENSKICKALVNKNVEVTKNVKANYFYKTSEKSFKKDFPSLSSMESALPDLEEQKGPSSSMASTLPSAKLSLELGKSNNCP